MSYIHVYKLKRKFETRLQQLFGQVGLIIDDGGRVE